MPSQRASRPQADRHYRSGQVPVGARLDPPDFEQFEARRKSENLTRRQALIAAIRDWTHRQHAPETTETTGGPQ